jgi:t-SNARE complex subunit (syntaxin)
MDITVLEQLKEFEDKQKSILESKKSEFLKKIDNERKDILNANKSEIQDLLKSRQSLLKEAEQDAKKDALSTIEDFKSKTKKLKTSSSKKIPAAVELIEKEFLGQNV